MEQDAIESCALFVNKGDASSWSRAMKGRLCRQRGCIGGSADAQGQAVLNVENAETKARARLTTGNGDTVPVIPAHNPEGWWPILP